MTEQVRTVKNILNAAYPSCKFDVRLKRAKDYARSSDRIIVTTEDIVVDDRGNIIIDANSDGFYILRKTYED